jgi:XRE family transcriptional regulator, stress-response regulator
LHRIGSGHQRWRKEVRMVLLRKVIGDALRARRLAQRRTLREVSTAANVSLGYLSEIERGHKEASSELLAAICEALGAPLSEMLTDVSATFALAELAEQMDSFSSPVGGDVSGAGDVAAVGGGVSAVGGSVEERAPGDEAVTEGDVTVQVHSDGPLKTTLTATRIPPGQRYPESVFVG